jgi:hypothetical protein
MGSTLTFQIIILSQKLSEKRGIGTAMWEEK